MKNRLVDYVSERQFDEALEGLRKALGDSGGREIAGEEAVTKREILRRCRDIVALAKASGSDGDVANALLFAGKIEYRLNQGIPLEKAHRAVLGLSDSSRIEGLDGPPQSSPTARMGGGPGRPAVKMNTGAPPPSMRRSYPRVNPVISGMIEAERQEYSFVAPNGETVTVTGGEILRKCTQLVRTGALSLVQAGDLERIINNGLAIKPEMLRAMFAG